MKQLNLVVEDKPGLLSDLSFILGKARINIESIYVGIIGGKAVINLTVKDDKKATELLKANGYMPMEFDILLIKLKDEPGELSKISKLMADNGINIEAIHVIAKGDGYVVDALKVDKISKAEKLLAPYLKIEDD